MLTLFHSCYQAAPAGFGGVAWQRTGLPYEGPVAAQPAWLMQAFSYLRDVYLELAHEHQKHSARNAKDRSRRG